jgi:UDP-N-acetylmuramyl pentapeptide synthase
VLELDDDVQTWVVELDSAFASLVRPTCAVLVEADAATELLLEVPADGVVAVNADDPRAFGQLLRARASRQVTFGFGSRAGHRIEARSAAGLEGSRVRLARPAAEPLDLFVPMFGDAGALALSAGVAVAEALEGSPLSAQSAAAALRALHRPGDERLAATQLADDTIILESRGEPSRRDPSCVRDAIDAARELATARGRRLLLVLVLGDEEQNDEGRGGLALHAAHARPAAVVATGEGASAFAREATAAGVDVVTAPDARGALFRVLSCRRPGDVLLIAAGLHEVARAIATEVTESPPDSRVA